MFRRPTTRTYALALFEAWRSNFASVPAGIVRLLLPMIYHVFAVFALLVLFRDLSVASRFSMSELLLTYGLAVSIRSLASISSDGVWTLPYMLDSGEFSYALSRPIPSISYIVAVRINPTSTGELAVGLLLCGYGVHWSPWRFLLCCTFAVACAPLFVAVGIAGSALHFWKGSLAGGVAYMLVNVTEAARYPTVIYPKVFAIVITYVLPVALAGSVPAQEILGGSTKSTVLTNLLVLIVGLFFLGVAITIWRAGESKLRRDGVALW